MKKIKNCLLAFVAITMLFACGETKKAITTNNDFQDGEPLRVVKKTEFLKFEKFDPNDFDENSIVIDNPWMPMLPGKELAYKGHDVDEDGEKIEHSVLYTVTDLTKVINGVNTVVLFERDFGPEFLEESELAFFAQDKYGNVWHFGQYVEIYEEGEFLGGHMWAAGHVDGAKAGIMMLADPEKNSRSYSQGFAPAPFNWTDRAKVYKTGMEISNPSGAHNNVLVIEEYSRTEPNAFQLKYYAKNVGNIGIGFIGNDQNKEVMDLVENRSLDAGALEKIREEAMELEGRAYIYGSTKPAAIRDNSVGSRE